MNFVENSTSCKCCRSKLRPAFGSASLKIIAQSHQLGRYSTETSLLLVNKVCGYHSIRLSRVSRGEVRITGKCFDIKNVCSQDIKVESSPNILDQSKIARLAKAGSTKDAL